MYLPLFSAVRSDLLLRLLSASPPFSSDFINIGLANLLYICSKIPKDAEKTSFSNHFTCDLQATTNNFNEKR